MQKLIYGLIVCALLITGCQSTNRSTSTPVEPVHNVPPAAYPEPANTNPSGTSQAYPAPLVSNPSGSDTYPGPGVSAGADATPNEYTPAAGDEKLTRGNAFMELENSSVALLESFPVQVKLNLKGSLPTPCYKLRVNPSQVNTEGRIDVEVYSLAEPGKVCTDVLQPFDVQISLGSFESGHYSVYINGELLGEFDA